MADTQTTTDTLTITLSRRPPVKITKGDWPVIASAFDRDHDGTIEEHANRREAWRLTVRQHTDGRAIVYGVYCFSSPFSGEPDRIVREGMLVGLDGDLPSAIYDVAEAMDRRIGSAVMKELAHETVAGLPAVVL